MSNQSLIQKRSIDFLSIAKSDIVNNKQGAFVGFKTKGIIKDGDITVKNDNIIVFKPGYFLKDRVNIQLTEEAYFSCDGFNDGFYFAVLEYVYEKVIPVPEAEFKVITLNEYLANQSKYLFLAEIRIDANSVSYITYETTNGVVNEKRDLLTFGNHNSLEGIQGGHPNSYYHLTGNEYQQLQSLTNLTITDHNTLSGLQGGQPGEYYHLKKDEYDASEFIIAGDVLGFKTTSFYINNGVTLNAGQLDGYAADQLALANHNHDHSQLLNKQGQGDYHLTEFQYNKYQEIVNDYLTSAPDANSLDGLTKDDLAKINHTHDHNLLLNLQGGQNNEYYHLSNQDYTTLKQILTDSDFVFNNTDNLNGFDSSYFALATHNHNHSYLLNQQGDGEYHLGENDYQQIIEIVNGSILAKNTNMLNGKTDTDFSKAVHTHDHALLQNVQGAGQYHVNETIYNAITTQNFEPTATNYFLTKSEFDRLFSGYNGAYDHNKTVGLQGGQTNEYYHLTESEYDTTVNNKLNELHNHDTLYYEKHLADGLFIDISGDSLTANLKLGEDVFHLNRIINVTPPDNNSSELPHVYGLVTKHFADVALSAAFIHNSLGGLQGDGSDYYHLTELQYQDLVAGQTTNLHNHSSLYYDKVTNDTRFVKKEGDTITGYLNLSGYNVVGLPTPSNDSDIVNKFTVDGMFLPAIGMLTDDPTNVSSPFKVETVIASSYETIRQTGLNYTISYLSEDNEPNGVNDFRRSSSFSFKLNTTLYTFVSKLVNSTNLVAFIDIYAHNINETSTTNDIKVTLSDYFLVSNILEFKGFIYFIAYKVSGSIPGGDIYYLIKAPIDDLLNVSTYEEVYSFQTILSRRSVYFYLHNGLINPINVFMNFRYGSYEQVDVGQHPELFSDIENIDLKLNLLGWDSIYLDNNQIKCLSIVKQTDISMTEFDITIPDTIHSIRHIAPVYVSNNITRYLVVCENLAKSFVIDFSNQTIVSCIGQNYFDQPIGLLTLDSKTFSNLVQFKPDIDQTTIYLTKTRYDLKSDYKLDLNFYIPYSGIHTSVPDFIELGPIERYGLEFMKSISDSNTIIFNKILDIDSTNQTIEIVVAESNKEGQQVDALLYKAVENYGDKYLLYYVKRS